MSLFLLIIRQHEEDSRLREKDDKSALANSIKASLQRPWDIFLPKRTALHECGNNSV
jgi:hypothetical protein